MLRTAVSCSGARIILYFRWFSSIEDLFFLAFFYVTRARFQENDLVMGEHQHHYHQRPIEIPILGA